MRTDTAQRVFKSQSHSTGVMSNKEPNHGGIEIVEEKLVAGERYLTLDVNGTEINIRGSDVQVAEIDFRER